MVGTSHRDRCLLHFYAMGEGFMMIKMESDRRMKQEVKRLVEELERREFDWMGGTDIGVLSG